MTHAGASRVRCTARLVLGFLVVLAGCGGDHDPRESPGSRHASSGTTVEPGVLVAAECPPEVAADTEAVTCWELTVPIDGDDPASGVVRLAIAVLSSAAASPEPDPVVILHGGPGAPLTATAGTWLSPATPYLQHRDVILVDQRGSGRSTPSLDCPEVDGTTTAGDEADALTACRDRLLAQGVALDSFTSADIARDVASLRVAMRIDQWNVVAVSFGTRVALELLAIDADGTRSAVLDSVYPPDVDAGAEQAGIAAAALRRLLQVAGRGDLIAPLDDTLVALADRPVTVTSSSDPGAPSVTDVIDDRVLAGRLFRTQYDTSHLGDVVDAVAAAVDGRLAEALPLLDGGALPADRGAGRPSAVSSTSRPSAESTLADSLSEGAYWLGECREGAGRSLVSVPPDRATGGDRGDPLAAALAADVAEVRSSCQIWAAEPIPASRVEATVVPVLLVTGEVDPVTPVRWARSTAEALGGSATELTVPRAGHGPSLSLSCVESVVAAFIEDPAEGTGPRLDAACAPPLSG